MAFRRYAKPQICPDTLFYILWVLRFLRDTLKMNDIKMIMNIQISLRADFDYVNKLGENVVVQKKFTEVLHNQNFLNPVPTSSRKDDHVCFTSHYIHEGILHTQLVC